MRRSKLVEAIDTVLSAVNAAGLMEFINAQAERGRGEKEPDEKVRAVGPKILELFRRYAIAADRFGPVERQLAGISNLDPLAEPGFWGAILEGHRLGELCANCVNGVRALTTFRELLAPKSTEIAPQAAGEPAKPLERFTIQVIEEEGRLSRPARLVNVLQGSR